MEINRDNIQSFSDERLAREIYLAAKSVVMEWPVAVTWLAELEAEQDRRKAGR